MIRTKSSAPRMMLPEQPIFCSPWSVTGRLPAQCSRQGPISEVRRMWRVNAKRGIANVIGATGKRELDFLSVPPQGYLAERRWEAQGPPGEADDVYATRDDTTVSDTGRTWRPTIADRNGVSGSCFS